MKRGEQSLALFLILSYMNAIASSQGACMFGHATDANPNFEISVKPLSRTIGLGESSTYSVYVTSQNGFNESILLSISSMPNGLSYEFTQEAVLPHPERIAATNLTLTVAATAGNLAIADQTIELNVTGSSKELVRTCQISVKVVPSEISLEFYGGYNVKEHDYICGGTKSYHYGYRTKHYLFWQNGSFAFELSEIRIGTLRSGGSSGGVRRLTKVNLVDRKTYDLQTEEFVGYSSLFLLPETRLGDSIPMSKLYVNYDVYTDQCSELGDIHYNGVVIGSEKRYLAVGTFDCWKVSLNASYEMGDFRWFKGSFEEYAYYDKESGLCIETERKERQIIYASREVRRRIGEADISFHSALDGGSLLRILPHRLQVPYHGQGLTAWCLPACVTMALRYHGRAVHLWDVADDLDLDRGHSPLFLWWRIGSYLEEQYELSCQYKGPFASARHDEMLSDILQSIDSNQTVILMIPSIQHAVIVTGYFTDLDRSRYPYLEEELGLFINDPSGRLFEALDNINAEYGKYTRNPVSVPTNWNDLKHTFSLFEPPEIIIIEEPPENTVDSTLYIEDDITGVVAYHMYRSGEFGRMYTLFGPDGIVWHADNHNLQLDSNDTLFVRCFIANHDHFSKSHGLFITMESEQNTTSLLQTLIHVPDFSVSEFSAFFQLSDYLEESGNYTIRLRVGWADEIILPPIYYEKLDDTSDEAAFSMEIESDERKNFCYQVTSGLSLITFNLTWKGSDLDLHVFDRRSRHVGANYQSGDNDSEIPESEYVSGEGFEQIMIRNPEIGTYRVEVFGTHVESEKEPFIVKVEKERAQPQSLHPFVVYFVPLAIFLVTTLAVFLVLRFGIRRYRMKA